MKLIVPMVVRRNEVGAGRLGGAAWERHRHLAAGDPAPEDLGHLDPDIRKPQARGQPAQPIRRNSEIGKCAEQHVTADTGGWIEDGEWDRAHEGEEYGRQGTFSADPRGLRYPAVATPA